MAQVEERISDGRVLDLIQDWLKADIPQGLDRWTPVEGSSQPSRSTSVKEPRAWQRWSVRQCRLIATARQPQ